MVTMFTARYNIGDTVRPVWAATDYDDGVVKSVAFSFDDDGLIVIQYGIQMSRNAARVVILEGNLVTVSVVP
jgi:hypothetical protein